MWVVEGENLTEENITVWVYGGASGYTDATHTFYQFFVSNSSWKIINVTDGNSLQYSSGIFLLLSFSSLILGKL